ncbi:hypothetical protein V7139_00450 [Neobacillus drentensis]
MIPKWFHPFIYDEYKEIENVWVMIQNDDVIMNGMCRKILATKKGYTK